MRSGHRTTGQPIEGLLLADKPAGMTSHDVVAVARRALGQRRIGHAGTLDPFATGLLVLLLGRATRLLPYIDGEPKTYDAVIRFGEETDSDDATGTITRRTPQPAEDAVARAITSLTGRIEQVPPAYSAKKVAGRRAYAAARNGEALRLEPVGVVVHEWTVLARRGAELEVTIVCSGGTYLRAVARDLGRLSGSAAHLVALRRTRSGPFYARDAESLERVRAGEARIRDPLEALRHLPLEILDEAMVRQIARGVPVEARANGSRAALVNTERSLVAIGERAGDHWQPRVVLVDA